MGLVTDTSLTGELCLPPDVVIAPVTQLHAQVRRQLRCADSDYVVSRPTGRTRSLLIDRQAAEFLLAFRRPSTLPQAVVAYAAPHGLAAQQLLDEVYPVAARLRALGLLVRPGEPAAAALAHRLSPGDRVAGWTVVGGVQALEDSEVYRALGPGGCSAALKIARRPADARLAATLHHEQAVLARLAGAPVPAVLAAGTEADRPYLVLEWIEGVDALAAARAARATAAAPSALRELCARLFEAYAAVHDRQVVHADVHPKNVLVAPDGTARLVDFGLARFLGAGAGPARQGVGYFFEPEYALAELAGRPLPPASVPGELYAVGALAHLMLTGRHYTDFPLERSAFLDAIAHTPPASFADSGAPAWPEVEQALSAALSKDPAHRPASARALAERLRAAPLPRARPRPARTAVPERPPTELAAFLPGGAWYPRQALRPPTASVHYGAAGVAYALLRLAQLTDDRTALAAADLWACRAGSALGGTERYWSPAIGITPEATGPTALHHTRFGIALVCALVAHARWDPPAVNAAVDEVVAGAHRPLDRIDLVSGEAGVLLACAQLLEALPDDPLLHCARLRAAGRQAAERLAERLRAAGVPGGSGLVSLGIAHGWAGALYAQLRWAKAARVLPSATLPDHLDRLAALAERDGARLRWPDRAGRPAAAAPFGAGWCGGAAGQVHLFGLADTVFPSCGYREVALGAGAEAWHAPDAGSSLCCGLTGRSYALLSLARLTGDRAWLDGAAELAHRAEPSADRPGTPAHSLYKGALGRALLELDLQHPDRSAHPLFAPEGWPPRARSKAPTQQTEGLR
ncbi:lanthionine synthetase LanC family protein [Kitasatospora sp. NPDC059673]|uniref:lanthionine synthetase LanC family protein n=1 Tax=Kitasatospora sp. NPDC059673 TaxID=3346901 RepID=UPI0036960819